MVSSPPSMVSQDFSALQMKRQGSQQQKGGNRQSGGANSTNTSQFRPYKLNDYKNMKNQQQNTRLGGLGANIGGEEWEKAQLKKQAAKQYAE